jgi:hypothetical protein
MPNGAPMQLNGSKWLTLGAQRSSGCSDAPRSVSAPRSRPWPPPARGRASRRVQPRQARRRVAAGRAPQAPRPWPRARARTTTGRGPTELLGRESGSRAKTERPWLRVDVSLRASLPHGGWIPMPPSEVWATWAHEAIGRLEAIEPIVPAKRTRPGREGLLNTSRGRANRLRAFAAASAANYCSRLSSFHPGRRSICRASGTTPAASRTSHPESNCMRCSRGGRPPCTPGWRSWITCGHDRE